MEDRYLFRGKQKYGVRPHFITGHYVSAPRPMIVSDKTRIGGGWDFDDIVPATVGQCTGLRDKNGTLIFEGDIIRFAWETRNKEIITSTGLVEWRAGMCAFMVDCEKARHFVPKENAEIIGNIHDNPELLERSADDE